MKKNTKKRVIVYSVLAGLIAINGASLITREAGPEIKEVTYTQILERIEDNPSTIKEAKISDGTRTVTLELEGNKEEVSGYPLMGGPALADRLEEADVKTDVAPVDDSLSFGEIVFSLLPFMLILVLVVYFIRKSGAGGISRFGKGRGEQAEVPETRFSDVAGADEAVEELREVVHYLKDSSKFADAGAKLPQGFLLEGPPGTGKTLLARAVAGEAGVPFYAVAGSDFVQMYAGLGAARVRSLFDKVKKHDQAILFIDEIDAVGQRRQGGGMGGSTQEHENTLIQLLSEMDGFEKSGVIVMAATNRADVLDPALTRPGRLDRKIMVTTPDRKGREDILKLYAKDKILSGVDLARVARQTPGLSGADLAHLMDQAAVVAVRNDRKTITAEDVQSALATVVLGPERKSAVISPRDQEITAWHEAGHTVAALLQKDADDPVHVSIIPRGVAGGVTWMTGPEDNFKTLEQNKASLVVSMAGRAAEKMLLNGSFTQGAAGDLAGATQLATQMISQYGMGGKMIFLSNEHFSVGNRLDQVIDQASTMLEDALAEAEGLLNANFYLVKALAEELLEKEALDGDEIHRVVETITGKTWPHPRDSEHGLVIDGDAAESAIL